MTVTLEQLAAKVADLERASGRSGAASVGHPRSHGTDAHVPRQNYGATAAPAVTDDSSKGYGPGSPWVDLTGDDSYVCVDGTVGAAVWVQTGGGLYSVHQYVLTPDEAPGTTVAAGTQVGTTFVSGPSDETVKRIVYIAEVAATTLTYTLDYAATEDMDAPGTWTEIDSNAVGTALGHIVSGSFTNATIPAQRLIRLSLSSVSGAPSTVTIILEVWRPIQFV